MSDTLKDKISSDLQKAQEEGTLRSEKIREIVKEAVSQTTLELKAGSNEIRTLLQDTVSATIETFKDRGETIKEEITASVEGAIAGIRSKKRLEITKTQTEIKQLQGQVDNQEQELQQEIDDALEDLKETSTNTSDTLKKTLDSAIEAIKNSEEVALMQKRYAQLKAQLAIVQANLAGRYGEQFEEVKQHLDEAQSWYEKAKAEPEVFTNKVAAKRAEFEEKLAETGKSLAKQEQQLKMRLQELWKSITELFRD